MRKPMGYILIIAGVVLAVVGTVMVTRKDSPSNCMESVMEADVGTPAKPEEIPNGSGLTESEQKGYDFEVWVKDHFDQNFFTLKEWRGDKHDKGTYAESNRYPDMEWSFDFNKKDVHETFAVECKWRKSFHNGSIEWASEENIEIYNKFAEDRNMPVFVVIGIGGTPKSPDDVYVVPLKSLRYPFVKKEYLLGFQREDVQKNFYYDYDKDLLR